jgi:hypothetical protein
MSPSLKDRELKEQAELEYQYYIQRMNGASTYNVSVGRNLDKAYFLDNLYKCPFQSAGCMHRFPDIKSMTVHRFKTHGVYLSDVVTIMSGRALGFHMLLLLSITSLR